MKNVIPKTYPEALEFLDKDTFKIIAGGTDLMVQNSSWAETLPSFKDNLLFVLNLPELHYINESDDFVNIGANITLEEIHDSKLCPPLLKQAIAIMASPALRHIATLAGNIGNASPAGDSLPVLYALDAIVVIESVDGIRELKIDETILGPRRTALHKNEIIKEIKIPIQSFTNYRFDKVGGRRADAISKISFVGAASVIDNKLVDLRLTFGAVGPVVVRKIELEYKFKNLSIEEVKSKVKAILADYEPFITPIDDQRSNKEYRKVVALNLLEDFIMSL